MKRKPRRRRKPCLYLFLLALVLLVSTTTFAQRRDVLTNFASDSIATISDTSWSINWYVLGKYTTPVYVYIQNLKAADIGLAVDDDTTLTSTYGTFIRIKASDTPNPFPLYGKKLRLKSLAPGTTGAAYIEIVKITSW